MPIHTNCVGFEGSPIKSVAISTIYTSNGKKEITFTINECWHHESEIFTSQITNIPIIERPVQLVDFKRYPNPNNGQITISYTPKGGTLSASVLIHDLAGRLILMRQFLSILRM